jgi:LPS-assembly protein
MARLKFSLLLVLFLFTGKSFLVCQGEQVEAQGVKIISEYYEKTEERIVARGNVEIHYKTITLFADNVEYIIETKDVHAQGNVTIRLPDEVVSSEEVTLNLDSSEWELKKAFGVIQPSIFYQAESISRRDENLYIFERAKITSCTQPVPRWRFSCSRANFKKDDYIEMYSAVFRIKKIPVFYLPYMRYPLDEERSTGLLMPQAGYSGQKGIFYSQSFYWAMKRNMDATINLDYFSDRGLGGGFEYRYLFSEGTGGRVNLYCFNFNNRAPLGSPENAYIIRLKHNQSLPLNFNFVADVDYQSSYDFLREFDNNFRRAVVSNRRSQVYLSRAWSYFNFNVRVSRFETYYKQTDNSVIRMNMPQLGLSSSKMKIFSPVYFSFDSSFDSWEYGWESQFESGKQRKSKSLSFSPALTIPFTAIPWLTLNSSFSTNFNYYFNSYAPGTNTVVNEPIMSQNYTVRLDLTGPVFSKIFFDKQNIPKLKHVIEPTFTYTYESPVDVSDRIIAQRFFYINHYARYGLVNHFLISKDGMPREICALGLDQTYYFDPENSPISRYKVDGEPPQFSDVNGYFRFYPGRNYSMDFSASFNTYKKNLSQIRLGLSLGNLNDSGFLRINWYKSKNPYVGEARLARHQIGVFGGIKIPRLALEAQADLDFNIIERQMLYSALILVYHYQCLDFKGELKIFYFRDKPEAQFRISFGLGNIGKSTDVLGGLGFGN